MSRSSGGYCRTQFFGSIVLLSAPFQFSDRLRARLPKLHRIMGRLYVLGVYVLAPTGAYIQYFQERGGAPRSFTLLAIVDAALLIGTTTLAGFFAFKRKIALHRQWATRSYAVALGVYLWSLLPGRHRCGDDGS